MNDTVSYNGQLIETDMFLQPGEETGNYFLKADISQWLRWMDLSILICITCIIEDTV